MNVQFLSDGSDFRSRGTGGYMAKQRRSSGMFWWTVLITLLVGLAVFCWFFSIMVFKYPEKPFNYRLLTKLKKIDEIKGFAIDLVPHGKFLNAKDLLASYYYYNTEQLAHANDSFKRNYILNYTQESPVYVRGNYTVVTARPLATADVIDQGWVVRARSVDMEDVEIELLLPGSVSEAAPYAEGATFMLDNKQAICAVMHVERSGVDGVCATVVPVVYGDYPLARDRTIAIVPPAKINVEATWPVMRGEAALAAAAAVSTTTKVAGAP
jgi:hypothetical protein